MMVPRFVYRSEEVTWSFLLQEPVFVHQEATSHCRLTRECPGLRCTARREIAGSIPRLGTSPNFPQDKQVDRAEASLALPWAYAYEAENRRTDVVAIEEQRPAHSVSKIALQYSAPSALLVHSSVPRVRGPPAG